MNLKNCISCGTNQDVVIKYTAAKTEVSWEEDDSGTNMLTLLNEIVIWPIPLCDNCSKMEYKAKITSDDVWHFFLLIFGIIVSPLALWGFSESEWVPRPFVKLVMLGVFIISVLAVIITLFLILKSRFKLIRFKITKTIPKNDEELAFIGKAEYILGIETPFTIISGSDDPKYEEYYRPRFLELDEMNLDNNTRNKIISWRESNKYSEQKWLNVHQLAFSTEDELLYNLRINEIID